MELVKNAVVKKARTDFQDDVKARKESIINGGGKVHGENFELSEKFDLKDEKIF